jgi:hypothetical protein
VQSSPIEQSKDSPVGTLEGFDEFYDVSLGTSGELPGNSQGTDLLPEEQTGYANGTDQWLTVEEAAKRLGISANAVIKRLGKGKLAGKKVPGQFGSKWSVDPDAVPQEILVDLVDGTAQEIPGNSKGTASPAQEQPGYADGLAQKSIDVLGDVIRQQTEQIKIQNDLIKHLSEQVQVKDLQMKLLTDSQHKPGWWSRFSSWFIGRS